MKNFIHLPGCRHDILGHHLKAWGILRALHQCASPENCDTEAEGWWDLENACFTIRSAKYDTFDKLTEFFAAHYRPTPFFSPWNTGSGMDEKKELVLSIDRKAVADFLRKNKKSLRNYGLRGGKSLWKDGCLTFDLKNGPLTLPKTKEIAVTVQTTTGRCPKQKVRIEWKSRTQKAFTRILQRKLPQLQLIGSVSKAVKDKIQSGEFNKDILVVNLKPNAQIPPIQSGFVSNVRTKLSGKKAVMAVLAKNSNNSQELNAALQLGREYFPRFQEDNADERLLLEALRDFSPEVNAGAFDSVFTTRASDRPQNNPLFLNRGDAGAAEIFRSLWNYFLELKKHGKTLAEQSINGTSNCTELSNDGKGSPFFPDAIKTYNNGSGWVVESFPFNALDYVLAVEGALSLRGSASRTLAANSRRFAAFPFIFETGENLTSYTGEITGTGNALWLPLWDRPVTYAELSSFICDAQSRLPGKEARFSSEFARALRAQGVDAGFCAWQEFRYKMKASDIPWVCTGTYIGQASSDIPLCLTDALRPLDESAFLDQFNVTRNKKGEIEKDGPHLYREAINSAIEATAASTTPENALEILVQIFKAVKQLTLSKSLRDKIHGVRFFEPLPCKPWNKLLEGFENDEFRIARALASITGQEKQPDNSCSDAQPMLGSILPLKLSFNGWYLPTKSSDLSKQAVWTGCDLYHDLSLVLQRRYLDSLSDQLPALRALHPAPLSDVLALLNGELDTQRILRWTEALSLIDWHYGDKSNLDDSTEPTDIPDETGSACSQSIPPTYAAARSLLEVECEWQGSDPALWQKRRSRIPFALLCQRSSHAVERSVAECLHWLSVWGVKNPDKTTRNETPRLRGKAIIKPGTIQISPEQASRLAAAVCVPLDWRVHFALYREITIPSKTQPKGN